MASFNLGRIKGERGEKGETGPKGERGEKGEKGDSAVLPSFSIGEVTTLPFGENAHAELDDSDPENVIINFFIPEGKNGVDGEGDMLLSVYDPENRKTDIFEYADSLIKNVLYETGGTLTGKLYAYNDNSSAMTVRNISVSDVLPSIKQNGDICILLKNDEGSRLADCSVGSTLIIKENGKEAEYIVTAKDYHEKGTVSVVRKYLLPYLLYFDRSGYFSYIQSSMEMHNEMYFFPRLEEEIKKNSMGISVTITEKRNVSMPTDQDMNNMEYFKLNKVKTATTKKSGGNLAYWIMGGNESDNVAWVMTAEGELISESVKNKNYVRPMLSLNGDMKVESTIYDGQAAVKVKKTQKGIFIVENGQWKECIS